MSVGGKDTAGARRGRDAGPYESGAPALCLSGLLAVAALALASQACKAGEIDGAAAYRRTCASCHGSDMLGAAAPALKGPVFVQLWRGRSAALYTSIARTMPLDAPASLSKSEYRAINDYVLAQNDFQGVTATDAAKLVATPIGDAAPTRLPAAATVFGVASTAGPDDAELLNPAKGDWLRYNLDFKGQRYSPLTQITPRNVATLAPKCIFQTGEIGSFQASPIVRDGRMYMTTPNRTYALDAATCAKLWSHEYVPVSPGMLPNNRGIALYKGMVIRGTLDGHLIALDAADGKLLWDVSVCDSQKGCFISAAPVVFDGKVFIGEAGADVGAAAHAHAFDAVNGRHLWTFDVIPSGDEPGAETWGKGAVLGGGAMWSTITVEPNTRRLFISTGNPGLDLDGRDRVGDNLYSDSVIVLDADTGRLQWYAQQIPHDVHDWDTGAAPMLYEQDGRSFVAVGSKDAQLYLYDRDTHHLLLRKVLARRINTMLPLSSAKGTLVCPGTLGGVEWYGPAYDPANRLLFVNSVDRCATLRLEENQASGTPWGGDIVHEPPSAARGSLRAFDAATGAERWVYEEGGPMLAGITPTASGLLLTGSSKGDFLAFDSRTGQKLYGFYTGGAIAGGISTYAVAGKQYIAVPSGSSSKSLWENTGAATIIVFGLP